MRESKREDKEKFKKKFDFLKVKKIPNQTNSPNSVSLLLSAIILYQGPLLHFASFESPKKNWYTTLAQSSKEKGEEKHQQQKISTINFTSLLANTKNTKICLKRTKYRATNTHSHKHIKRMRVGRAREIVMDSYCFYHILLYIIIILKGKCETGKLFLRFSFCRKVVNIYHGDTHSICSIVVKTCDFFLY